ncbi:MAG TPA: hypothetical protein VN109_02795 [Devosia sp.]|jgi:hypothetical protein|nr:hypothetical protein [Devosia sp.]
MGIIEKIVVSDETMQALERDARQHGRTVAEEVAKRIEGEKNRTSRDALVERARVFRASLPAQTIDSLALLREDRDR